MKKNSAAFTLIELLVVISIIAVLAGLAVPALTSAMTRGQMTATMNNARQLYLAAFQMANDGSANSDPNLAWPGDLTSSSSSGASGGSVATLQDYCNKLVQNDYLKAGDLQKILTAPSANCVVNYDASASTPSVTLAGKSALKVYKVTGNDASNTLFAVTSNYTYNQALKATDTPYGDKGFVVIRKGGDASVLRKNQATDSNTGGDKTKFQNFMGVLTGGATTESSDMVLTNPNG